MPIKLLCCTSSMESGGSERQMLQLLQHLHRDRIEPHLYLTYKIGTLLDQLPSDVIVDYFAVKDSSKYAVIPGALFTLQIRKLRRTILQRKVDVTYDRLYHTVMLGAAATRGLNVARVVTVVSPPSEDFGRSRQRWMLIKRKILSWSYRSATELIAVSEESAKDAASFYHIPIERWRVLPSPIHLEKIEQNAKQPPPPSFQTHTGLDIAVLGRLSKEKNHRLLIEALSVLRRAQSNKPNDATNPSALHDSHLHIIGDGNMRDDLTELVRSLALERNVTFYGVQSNPHSIVSRCDCLCLPSFYEGFPNVVMEAMACRVPVFASDRAGGLRALVGNDERGRLLAPDDAQAWIGALIEFTEQPHVARSKTDSAYRFVRTHHDLPKWINDMEEIFEVAAAKHPR